jgi:WD40 repeat protein
MLEVEPHKPLHNGWLEVIIQDGDYFLTAGADGWIKWWRISEIDSAEAEEGVDYAIAPVREILIAKNEQTGEDPAYIINMTLANNKWYIQDLNGGIYVMDHDSDGVYRNVYNFHKGAINDLVCSPTHNYAISLGEDGLVKVWDYAKKDQMDCYDQKYYDGEGTCLTHMPHTDANKGRLCAMGFANGIVRIVSVTADHLSLLKAFKAHDEPVLAMKFSRDLRLLATASSAGNVFFFDLDPHSDIQKFEPLCTVKLPDEAEILDFKWDPED